jgi:hypothetical protein
MSSDQIAKQWREDLTEKLRDRYGLSAEEAGKKADIWLNWLQMQPSPQHPAQMAVEAQDKRSRSRLRAAPVSPNRDHGAPQVLKRQSSRAAETKDRAPF